MEFPLCGVQDHKENDCCFDELDFTSPSETFVVSLKSLQTSEISLRCVKGLKGSEQWESVHRD